MALAPYYSRSAVAAAQALQGFDETLFRGRLEATPIGIAFDDSAKTPDGEALLDLLVRLLARLYPQLALIGPADKTGRLAGLAKAINPKIELIADAPVGVAAGAIKGPFATTIYAGADGWDALIDTEVPQPLANSDNPFGAGVSACLAAANVFRRVFLDDWESRADNKLRFSSFAVDRVDRATRRSRQGWQLKGDAVVAGLGAIGNATVWALARASATGTVHLVDHQSIELSNVQRYVLAEASGEGAIKVDIGSGVPTRGLNFVAHQQRLAEFLSSNGYKWEYFLLALDSASDRRSAQASLPRWVANAWTQPGDLGVSTHPEFAAEGACVACLYLPRERLPNEDELVAGTLNVPHLQMDVRTLLYSGAPLERPFLEAVAAGVGRPIEVLLPFEGRTIRDLYVDGFCGGAVIPLGQAGQPRQDVHVPLAHQSALAGTLLAAALMRSTMGNDPPVTSATRLDVLNSIGRDHRQPIRRQHDGRCLCDDDYFVDAYHAKYGGEVVSTRTRHADGF
jgi:hypothetical protein